MVAFQYNFLVKSSRNSSLAGWKLKRGKVKQDLECVCPGLNPGFADELTFLTVSLLKVTTLTVPIACSYGTSKRGNPSIEQDAWHLVSTASMPVVVVITVDLLTSRTACGSGIWRFIVLEKTVVFLCFLSWTDLKRSA